MTQEDVIKGLECLAKQHGIVGVCEPENCPYGDLHTCANEIARDAIALLKAQEPVEPKVYEGMRVLPDNINIRYSYPVTDVFYDCGECGVNLCRHQPNHFIRFCKHCGRAVKWDG